MSKNITVINRWFDEAINQGQLEILDELFDPGVVAHEPPGDSHGIDDGPRKAVSALRAGFPDFKATIEDLIASDDRVAVRWTATGTHRGEFMGIAPTEKTIRFNAIYIYRFVDEKIAEVWASPDALGLLKQLSTTT